ncbi:MAG: hypothetical protein RLZZ350_2415 [Verrucomicrobiota bacterium]|jgi:hypothetical protein
MKTRVAIFSAVLALVLLTVAALERTKAKQHLAPPGIRLTPLTDGRSPILLPERVGEFTAHNIETPAVFEKTLPPDTSFALRHYTTDDGFRAQLSVVVMGTDRSSIHRPQACLPGQGLQIVATENITMPVGDGAIPALKLSLRLQQQLPTGERHELHGFYFYWFVSDRELSADSSGLHRAQADTARLLRTGELTRWAYVSLFTTCEPDADEATLMRLKKLAASVVPEFQLTPPQNRKDCPPASARLN